MPHAAKHKSHNNEFSDDIEQLGEDVGRIKDDLTEAVKDVGHAAASGVARAKRGVSEGYDTARDQGKVLVKTLTDQVQERPWTCIAIAAGAGLILGMFLSRRD